MKFASGGGHVLHDNVPASAEQLHDGSRTAGTGRPSRAALRQESQSAHGRSRAWISLAETSLSTSRTRSTPEPRPSTTTSPPMRTWLRGRSGLESCRATPAGRCAGAPRRMAMVRIGRFAARFECGNPSTGRSRPSQPGNLRSAGDSEAPGRIRPSGGARFARAEARRRIRTALGLEPAASRCPPPDRVCRRASPPRCGSSADQGMPGLRLALPRPEQQRQSALVRHADVREPRQDAAVLSLAAALVTTSGSCQTFRKRDASCENTQQPGRPSPAPYAARSVFDDLHETCV
jgi:hypothetical protein